MAIRSRNLYKPNQEKPFKLSRSKVDNFISCRRCFYNGSHKTIIRHLLTVARPRQNVVNNVVMKPNRTYNLERMLSVCFCK